MPYHAASLLLLLRKPNPSFEARVAWNDVYALVRLTESDYEIFGESDGESEIQISMRIKAACAHTQTHTRGNGAR